MPRPAEEFQVLPLAAAAAAGGAAFVDGGVFAAIAQAVRRMQEGDAEELAVTWADQPAAVARGTEAFAKQSEALQVAGALAACSCGAVMWHLASNADACAVMPGGFVLGAVQGAGESARRAVMQGSHAPWQAILATAEQSELNACAGDRESAAAPVPAAAAAAAAAAAPVAVAEATASPAAEAAVVAAGSRKRKPGSRASRRSLLVQTTKVWGLFIR